MTDLSEKFEDTKWQSEAVYRWRDNAMATTTNKGTNTTQKNKD
jgi:hypothetical protein